MAIREGNAAVQPPTATEETPMQQGPTTLVLELPVMPMLSLH